MDKYESDCFEKIKNNFKLLKCNWNALSSNPPCKNYINDNIAGLEKYITMLDSNNELQHQYRKNFYNRHKRLSNT